MVASGVGRVAQVQEGRETEREAAHPSRSLHWQMHRDPNVRSNLSSYFCLLRNFFSWLKLILGSGWKGYIPNLEGLECMWNIKQSVCMCCCK